VEVYGIVGFMYKMVDEDGNNMTEMSMTSLSKANWKALKSIDIRFYCK